MNRLLEFNRIYAIVVGLVAAVTSAVLLDSITKLVGARAPAFAIVLVIVGSASFGIAYLLNGFIDNSVVARRYIVGNEFIEGVWWDVTSNASGQVMHGVVIHIAYDGGSIILSGSEYEVSGRKSGTFKSKASVYKERVLFCEYEMRAMLYDLPVETGVMQLQFSDPADSYTGFYIDYGGKVRGRICGYLAATAGTPESKRLLAEKEKQRFIVAKMKETAKSCQDAGAI